MGWKEGAECGEGTPRGTGPHIVSSRWAELQGGRCKNKYKLSGAAAQPGRKGSVSPLGHPNPERMTSPSSPSHDSALPAGAGPFPHQKKQPRLTLAPHLREPSRPLRGSMGMRGAVEDSPEPRDLGSDANFAPDSWDILGRPSSL